MLHDARDRQKFFSDVQYLRDMQHKVDSEYQACLRRQEYRRDPNEKKRDQFWGQETSFERSRFSSRSSSKQSSSEEDPLTEPRSSTKISTFKCDSKLPAIDQTSVKQKHKSTMTARKADKADPSEPSPADEAPMVLLRKRKPNLRRFTVSPELHSPRASEDRSRQKPQWPAKVPAPRRADQVVQQGDLMCNTKLKKPTRERRNLVPSSQPVIENPPDRRKKGDPSAPSQNELHPALPQAFQGTNSPQVLSEFLGPPLTPTTVGGPRRASFRFRDEDFYSILSLNSGRESDDTEEETQAEECLWVGMHSPRSPSHHKRSRFGRTSTPQAKNKNFEENAENCRGHSSRRSEPRHGSLRISNAMEPATEWPSAGQKLSQDSRLPDRESAKEKDRGGSEHAKKSPLSWDTKYKPRQEDGVNAENAWSDCISVEHRPGTHDSEGYWQDYLSSSQNSLDYFLSGRPTSPGSSVNSSYNSAVSFMHSALRDDIPVDLSMSSTSIHSSDSEGNSRFHVRRPLSPIRNRNPSASAENHNYFPVNSAHEFAVREAEDITLTSQPQGAPLYTDLLLNPQGSLSLVDSSNSSPSRINSEGYFRVSESLQENIPFTFFAVSDFPNQNENGNRMAAFGFTDEKETSKIKADPEKLKKLQESLLEEDSEEEGDLCRICQIAGGSPSNPLLEPCGCVGSLRFVHQECLKKWLKVKITSGADLGAVKTCEMCKQGLLVDLGDFNMIEFYQKHQQSQAQNELMNSGLYLVLLLHLYEQRFAELMRLNHNQVERERIRSWEMEMKAAFLKAGSSSKEANHGARQSPLPPALLSTSPSASLPPLLY
ncbi:probable E3 ubiquitin-protein ligase MARCH10 isoform X1 [Papio anubis]|uniref:probable E3 ubiquitin-protein ligase MARCH10 isoform X1 n=1 Tax=Papio anubis TaxID=9555 RepID=UPI0012AE4321|nr:probable E3 ubiquitin-protein ligase MARCH10 isoform X1 [Papio anubis]XP_017806324.2 probable E3 ubiquitin-protein ligase MARCH10 isoform X1 [Papio anubis]XP_017806326.2 probable E3 ubiquitin-protein ligase MARCH10 isoform X1 [Papio anubis]XP_017806327.2 probable E3 ubiquitin-protein ligase MARCH10 isoform X1 [Papio anubis]XP_017806328.2 probable E3 ubiquitin-protein ligase MARCH10 isoform X1 [Papio anubis]XP_031513522.1 probable E3 ubiquitin-protein ligase MARCH10 isoform X1 [Papio anubis]